MSWIQGHLGCLSPRDHHQTMNSCLLADLPVACSNYIPSIPGTSVCTLHQERDVCIHMRMHAAQQGCSLASGSESSVDVAPGPSHLAARCFHPIEVCKPVAAVSCRSLTSGGKDSPSRCVTHTHDRKCIQALEIKLMMLTKCMLCSSLRSVHKDVATATVPTDDYQ